MNLCKRAFMAGLIVALMCPLIGTFIVIKRQSLLSEGLGHVAFAALQGLRYYPFIRLWAPLY